MDAGVRRVSVAIAALLALLLFVVAVSADGGAPPRPRGGGGTEWGPRLEAWSLGPAVQGCVWRGTVWLSSSSVPVVLLGTSGQGWALFSTDEGTGERYFTAPQPQSWWWRGHGQRVHVELPAPCELRALTLALNYEGTSLTGERVSMAQVVELGLTS